MRVPQEGQGAFGVAGPTQRRLVDGEAPGRLPRRQDPPGVHSAPPTCGGSPLWWADQGQRIGAPALHPSPEGERPRPLGFVP